MLLSIVFRNNYSFRGMSVTSHAMAGGRGSIFVSFYSSRSYLWQEAERAGYRTGTRVHKCAVNPVKFKLPVQYSVFKVHYGKTKL